MKEYVQVQFKMHCWFWCDTRKSVVDNKNNLQTLKINKNENLFLPVILAITISGSLSAQKFYTKKHNGIWCHFIFLTGKNWRYNRSATCVVDTKSGAIQFAVLMKGFAFERALMEEHFNETMLRAASFPNQNSKGKLKDAEDIDFTKDGTYTLKVKRRPWPCMARQRSGNNRQAGGKRWQDKCRCGNSVLSCLTLIYLFPALWLIKWQKLPRSPSLFPGSRPKPINGQYMKKY